MDYLLRGIASFGVALAGLSVNAWIMTAVMVATVGWHGEVSDWYLLCLAPGILIGGSVGWRITA